MRLGLRWASNEQTKGWLNLRRSTRKAIATTFQAKERVAMLLVSCQTLFSGGPHNGHLISLDRLPKKSLVVPADPTWRELPQVELTRPTKGLAAVYVRVGTRMNRRADDNQWFWHYRFLTYCSQFAGEEHPPEAVNSRPAVAR
jgi:hypothetical protein